MKNREPLNDVQAERALLGTLLLEPTFLLELDGLRYSDFHDRRHAPVLAALHRMLERGAAVDAVTVCAELEDMGDLEEVGGMAYLGLLVNSVPPAMAAQDYAEVVMGLARRRDILAAASEIVQLAWNRGLDVGEVEERAEQALIDAVREQSGANRPIVEVVDSVFRQAERNVKEPIAAGAVRHLDTGWPDLNRALGGWHPASLVIVLGAPHMGKSWFALQAMANVCDAGGRGLFFPLEMTAHKLVERLSLAAAKLSQYRFDLGQIEPDEWQRIVEREAQMYDWDLVIDERAQTIGQIATAVRREHLRKPLDLVVVDYLGLVTGDGNAQNRNLELGYYTRRLKLLARDTGVPFIVPCQVSGKAIGARNDKRPTLSDAYESGHVDQDADVVLGLYRDEFYNQGTERPHMMDMYVLKDRLAGNAGCAVHFYFSQYGAILTADTKAVDPGLEEDWTEIAWG